MKNNILILILTGIISSVSWSQTNTESTIVIGQIPGKYIAGAKSDSYVFGYLEISNRVIQKIEQIKEADVAKVETANKGKVVIKLLRKGEKKYDVIYPGLINLHNHTKQNNIPIWGDAQGQFANRFEWRDFKLYKFAVSGNMNPWVDYVKANECATFRWSELSAMVLGTTYLQGPSSCVSDFAIQRVEDTSSYVSQKANVQAPTDLVDPDEMGLFWNDLRPVIQSGKTYEFALSELIKKYCPTLAVTEQNINTTETLKIFADVARLNTACTVLEGMPKSFIRYINRIHPALAGRKNYFYNNARQPAAIIAHLAEGRRDDPYNQKEYELVKLLGLDLPKMNFVHGVGIPESTYPELAQKDIGLIWSPFSNLILYSQTLNVAAALKSGVNVAIGSDWVPTGTKSVLEEVKIARNYILKDLDKEGLVAAFSGGTGDQGKIDEVLFKMITENPAKMINHFEIKKATDLKKFPSGFEEAAVGTIAVGAMGSVIAVSHQDANPFTNLVKLASEKDINLVLIDGKPVYGNKSYMDNLGLQGKYEVLPVDSDSYSELQAPADVKAPEDVSPELRLGFITKLISLLDRTFSINNKCSFKEEKVFIAMGSVEKDADLSAFKLSTGINLDKVQDITKLLAVNLMTQSRNKIGHPEGNINYALKAFPPLFSCNDEKHMARISNFIKVGSSDDFESNRKYRKEVIEKNGLGRIPAKMADTYK